MTNTTPEIRIPLTGGIRGKPGPQGPQGPPGGVIVSETEPPGEPNVIWIIYEPSTP